MRRMRRLHYNIIPWYLAPLGVSWALVVFAALRVAARHAPPGYFMDLMRNPATAAPRTAAARRYERQFTGDNSFQKCDYPTARRVAQAAYSIGSSELAQCPEGG